MYSCHRHHVCKQDSALARILLASGTLDRHISAINRIVHCLSCSAEREKPKNNWKVGTTWLQASSQASWGSPLMSMRTPSPGLMSGSVSLTAWPFEVGKEICGGVITIVLAILAHYWLRCYLQRKIFFASSLQLLIIGNSRLSLRNVTILV